MNGGITSTSAAHGPTSAIASTRASAIAIEPFIFQLPAISGLRSVSFMACPGIFSEFRAVVYLRLPLGAAWLTKLRFSVRSRLYEKTLRPEQAPYGRLGPKRNREPRRPLQRLRLVRQQRLLHGRSATPVRSAVNGRACKTVVS